MAAAHHAVAQLASCGAQVLVEDEVLAAFASGSVTSLNAPDARADVILSLGGDGTLLRGAQYALSWDAALLGVNLGRVGFLAEGEADALPRLLDKVIRYILGLAGSILSHIPDGALSLGTAVISSFLISARLPKIKSWLKKRLPEEKLKPAADALKRMKNAVGGWLTAQLKLMGITFLILNAGLLLLRVRYPVLAALVITVVDALPVFGTGTILIPWALALFLQGETKTGIGLVILYGAAALSRQALEPRLVGKQVGLNPVLTLLALYTGYRLLGVGGMIVFPIAAMLFKQLWDHSGLQPDG